MSHKLKSCECSNFIICGRYVIFSLPVDYCTVVEGACSYEIVGDRVAQRRDRFEYQTDLHSIYTCETPIFLMILKFCEFCSKKNNIQSVLSDRAGG